MQTTQAFQLHPSDNVVVAGGNFNPGEAIEGCSTVPAQLVLSGHKMSVNAIAAGESVIKFGQVIGQATCEIAPGQHVHEHNLRMSAHSNDYAYAKDACSPVLLPDRDRDTFMGYRRGDGKVGTRNYVGIISSVNCSATVASLIVREIEKRAVLEDFPNVDGIVAITHGVGCAVSTVNEGFRMLQRTIWGHARHPNFGSAMMVGLGCEANQIPLMVEHFGKPPEGSLHFTTIQHNGGTRRTIEACLDKLHNVDRTVAHFAKVLDQVV